ncbi:MAG TPA: oligopeptide transporter, OPT family, partial [Coprothermobacter sp.]|nr:oligopeptide transporter, OPT family [Coprothermobacter sp.]
MTQEPKKDEVDFTPYVSSDATMPEVTVLSVVTGIILLIIFGAANAYLGLKVGMTVSASIPAAVVSMAVLRGLFKRGTILENNIVQTITSTGEAVAAGVVFSLPALYMLGHSPSLMLISLVSL